MTEGSLNDRAFITAILYSCTEALYIVPHRMFLLKKRKDMNPNLENGGNLKLC